MPLNLAHWFFPREIETFFSGPNGIGRVYKFRRDYQIYVGNFQQSGPWVKKVWQAGLKELSSLHHEHPPYIGEILILGQGAGKLSSLVESNWPMAQISGVEQDPVMIKLGEKYFGLSKSRNLRLYIEDAYSHIVSQRPFGRYDLIFVDLYTGKQFPQQFESQQFLKSLSENVSAHGLVIFNRLADKNANFVLEDFLDKLKEFFKIRRILKVEFNVLVFCSRK